VASKHRHRAAPRYASLLTCGYWTYRVYLPPAALAARAYYVSGDALVLELLCPPYKEVGRAV